MTTIRAGKKRWERRQCDGHRNEMRRIIWGDGRKKGFRRKWSNTKEKRRIRWKEGLMSEGLQAEVQMDGGLQQGRKQVRKERKEGLEGQTDQ